MHDLLTAAERDSDFEKLRRYIEAHTRFRPSMAHSIGWTGADSSENLILVMAEPDSSTKDHGMVAWTRLADGHAHSRGELLHYLNPEAKPTTVAELFAVMKMTGLDVVNGQVIVQDDYGSCMFNNIALCCTPSFFACAASGPGWLVCAGILCEVCLLVAGGICNICNSDPSRCPG